MASSKITKHFKVNKTEKDLDLKIKKSRAVTLQSADSTPATSAAQTDTDKDLEMLKGFDLNWEYGPCMGLTRLERWNRAEKFGLKPPSTVRDIIVQHCEDERYTHSLWNEYKIFQ